MPGGVDGIGDESWWPLKYHSSKTRRTRTASMNKPKWLPAVLDRRAGRRFTIHA